MNFFLSKFSTKLTIILVCVLLLSNHIKSATRIDLPQNLYVKLDEECLLAILKDFELRRSSNPLEGFMSLYDHIQPGLERTIDITSLLLQFYNLKDIDDRDTGYKFEPRKMINECNLNLSAAIKRCQGSYGGMPCEQILYGNDKYNKAPFAAPKCPFGFQRYGCCKCLRTCNYTDSIEADSEAGEDITNKSGWTKTNYCVKKEALNSTIKRLSGTEKYAIGSDLNDWEMLEESEGHFVYVKNCPKDYKRIGNRMCMALCPLGWDDTGNSCYKQGELVFYPFVWQPGDQRVVRD